MASSAFSIVRQALCTVARGVSPFDDAPTQVVLGTYNVAAATKMFADILTSGPWLFIHPASTSVNGQTFNGAFEIKCELLTGFAGDTSHDYIASDDIVAALIKAWTDYSKWVSGKAFGPFTIATGEPNVISKLKPVITSTPIVFGCKFIADQTYPSVVLNDDSDVVFSNDDLVTTP